MVSAKKYSLYDLKAAVEKIEEKDSTVCLNLVHPFYPKDLHKIFPKNDIFLMETKKEFRIKKVLGFKIKKTLFEASFKKV